VDPLLRPFVEMPEEGSPLIPLTFIAASGDVIIGVISRRGAFSESVQSHLEQLASSHPDSRGLPELLAKFRAFLPYEEFHERYITLQDVMVITMGGRTGGGDRRHARTYEVPMLRLDLDSVIAWVVGKFAG
jgi:hypothetical protein